MKHIRLIGKGGVPKAAAVELITPRFDKKPPINATMTL